MYTAFPTVDSFEAHLDLIGAVALEQLVAAELVAAELVAAVLVAAVLVAAELVAAELVAAVQLVLLAV